MMSGIVKERLSESDSLRMSLLPFQDCGAHPQAILRGDLSNSLSLIGKTYLHFYHWKFLFPLLMSSHLSPQVGTLDWKRFWRLSFP